MKFRIKSKIIPYDKVNINLIIDTKYGPAYWVGTHFIKFKDNTHDTVYKIVPLSECKIDYDMKCVVMSKSYKYVSACYCKIPY